MRAATEFIAILSLAAGAAAQNGQSMQPPIEVNRHPVKLTGPPPATVAAQSPWLQKDVRARLDALIPDARTKGSAGATLVDYGSCKVQLSVRAQSGGAEVHAHWDDVMIVEAGSATLVTGGRVVAGTTDADGETRGSKIEGGQTLALNAGDTVTIRAGTPHQILLSPGTIYEALVIKVHEP